MGETGAQALTTNPRSMRESAERHSVGYSSGGVGGTEWTDARVAKTTGPIKILVRYKHSLRGKGEGVPPNPALLPNQTSPPPLFGNPAYR